MPNAQAERLADMAERHLGAARFSDADMTASSALLLDPRCARALCIKALIAAHAGRDDSATSSAEKALALAPRVPSVLNNAACVFARVGLLDRAFDTWRRLVAIIPGSVDAHYNMGVTHARLGDYDSAEPCFRKVMAIKRDHPAVYMNLADILKSSGRIEEAVTVAREGVRRRPDDARQYGALLYSLHFHPDSTPESLHREHAEWGRAFEASIKPFDHHDNDRTPDRALRIGYVSPNFRDHSETYFVLPLFRGTDRALFKTYAYSCNESDDTTTALLRQHADAWRDVGTFNDDALAHAIRDDRIDVLVDLTMHMQGGRLGLFARKPAPVQVAWLAYPSTTGLARMDYTILDPHLDRTGSPHYTEKPYFLPDCYWCYEVYGPRPDVSPLPADSNGHITFGSLNHYGKVTRETLDAWAQLLARVDGSRLVLHVGSNGAADAVRAVLAGYGIEPSRLVTQGRVSREQYLRTHHHFDIALDTFPYNGATTTCDSLWMGVPVVSRAGETAVSRAGLSICSNTGLPELVARDWNEYIDIAANLAADRPRLRTLRSTLRARLEQSKVMDASAFASAMTSAYRVMWTAWCAQ